MHQTPTPTDRPTTEQLLNTKRRIRLRRKEEKKKASNFDASPADKFPGHRAATNTERTI
jgi:hypothetical protein